MAENNNAVADPVSQEPPAQTQTHTHTTPPPFPATSINENGLGKRPRDARLIHMILANFGVTSYQERVPLQLMDFAYRYTSSALSDALHLTTENYGGSNTGTSRGAAANDLSGMTLQSLKLSIASRNHYQFNPGLPREYLQEMAQEKNRIGLPAIGKDPGGGLRLPPERYCLTGVGFGLKEEWESEGEEIIGGEDAMDVSMADNMGENEDEDAEPKAADIFGDDFGAGDEDEDMGDA